MPGFFAEAGLTDIEVFVADKPGALFPPYASEDQQALKADLERDGLETLWGWTREQAERYYTAGGGEAFAPAWERRRAAARRVADSLAAGTFTTAGGMLLYLIAGRK